MKVNVSLYGGYSNDKSRAEIIDCEYCSECSLYQKGKCAAVTSGFTDNCKLGKKRIVSGYTKRSSKYDEFMNRYRMDECFDACSYPNHDWRVAVAGDTVLMNLVYAVVDNRVRNEMTNEWVTVKPYAPRQLVFSGKFSYVPKSEMTPELVNRIANYSPISIDGCSAVYSQKVVPMFLKELKDLCPDIYAAAVSEYPELGKARIDYRGKMAYIYSLRDGVEIKDRFGTFLKRGGKLYCANYSGGFPFGAKTGNIILDIYDTMTVEIMDNSIVDEDTVFV